MAKIGDDAAIFWRLTEAEVQEHAQSVVGRALSDDELGSAREAFSWGLECWEKVLHDAIREAVK